jgi:HEAT repeat protein
LHIYFDTGERVMSRSIFHALCLCTLAFCQAVHAQQPADRIDFGTTGLDIPAATERVSVSPRTVTAIGETMLRESGTRRLRLARDLGECRSALALPYLRQILTDKGPALRAEAARSAARIGDAAILPAVQSLLRDVDASVRREAVVACAALGDEDAATAALRDADEAVVAAALRVSRRADAIAARLSDLPPTLRTQAIRRLGALGARDHAAAIARFLTASDTSTRIAAIETLTALNATDSAEAVRSLMRDDHPAVRRAATAALTLTEASQRVRYALPMLNDAEPEVRQAAVIVLAGNPRDDALPFLGQQLDDGDEPLRLAAREALVPLKGSADLAGKLLTNPDPRRREDGSYLLGKIRSDGSLQAHLALLKDADWTVVAQAASSLGRIGRPEAREPIAVMVRSIPATASLLPRDQQHAFAEAVIAAARLSDGSALDRIAQLIVELAPTDQRGPAPRLRAACAWAFGVLGSASDSATCDALLNMGGEFLEQREPKVEAIKALGHLRYAPASDALKQTAETSPDPQIRWMAWWAYERTSGVRMKYSPPVHVIVPDVSIVELPN